MIRKKCGWASWAFILVIIGGINWGLIGIGGFAKANLNVINLIFGGVPALEWIIYILIGIVAVYMIFGCKKCEKCQSCPTCVPAGGAREESSDDKEEGTTV